MKDNGSLSRRAFLRAGGFLLAGALVERSIGWAAAADGDSPARRTLWSMGGWNFLEVTAPDAATRSAALTAAVDAIRRTDRLFSVFDLRTPLSRFNAADDLSYAVDDEDLIESIDCALQVARATGGAFDPTVEPLMRRWGFRNETRTLGCEQSSRLDYASIRCDRRRSRLEREQTGVMLDPGAWAKGLAAQRACEAAVRVGANGVLVNCGCDLYHAGGAPWECQIRDPRGAAGDAAFVCRHSYPAVATSANYETFRRLPDGTRIGHLMDPRAGVPAESDLESVTVFGSDGLAVDAVASALFVMGAGAASEWLKQHGHYGAILLSGGWESAPGRVVVTGDVDVRCLTPGEPK